MADLGGCCCRYTSVYAFDGNGEQRYALRELASWLLSGALIGLGLLFLDESLQFPDLPGALPTDGQWDPSSRPWRDYPACAWPGDLRFLLRQVRLWLFAKSYTLMYHFILGIVVGSTLAIIPGVSEDGLSSCVLFCLPLALRVPTLCPSSTRSIPTNRSSRIMMQWQTLGSPATELDHP